MGDRFFPNLMPDFVAESSGKSSADAKGTPATDSLMELLSMPFPALNERFKRAALDLKETVVAETWGTSGQGAHEFSLYSGVLGTALLLFKAYQITKDDSDLTLSSEIINVCDSATSGSRDVTFAIGRAGVCALGAVVAKHAGDQQKLSYYITQFKEIELPENVPDELLHGRAGFLWACLYLNEHIGEETIPSATTSAVVKELIEKGRAQAEKGSCPLMFDWYGEKYWGAAHGLTGIMDVLMHMELKSDEADDVKGTLRYMTKNRFTSGNYPSSEEDKKRDVLVQWCHGAPGIALTLAKAAKVFVDREFWEAAVDAADVVWSRGLLKRVGVCHGVSGNAYVFLALHRLTGKQEYLYRARAFACFLLDRAQKLISQGEMQGGDSPYSIFEGLGGMAYLFLDILKPSEAKFPGYEF